ncbi:MAG: nitrous oxide reductase family maturation protein NosD, partial [Promethearchaeota archaeon]
MSKIPKCAASLILMLLVLSIMPSVILESPIQYAVYKSEYSQKAVANDPHGPIVINGDANFSATALVEGWTGTGSAQEPYIIENYDFVLGFTPVSSVNISHTRLHFIIRNCNFQGPQATPSFGIYLDNVTNAQVIENVVTGYSHAVHIPITSSNILVLGNNCSFNSYGIYLHDSEDSTVINNICNGNFFYGIFLHTCESSSVIDNICNEDPMAGIYIYNCSLNTVSGNTCNDSDFGIYLQERGSHVVTNNLCANNSDCGFYFDNCDLNVIANNTSVGNTMWGITLQNAADFNSVLWNAVINNTADDVSDFSSGNTFTHNYYSDYGGVDTNQDYIGDTSHTFQFNTDSYPLMYVPFAPEWV